MICAECGKEFRPSGRGSTNKYCSGACRAKAYRKRKKSGIVTAPRHRKKKSTVPAKTEKAEKPEPAPELDRRSFERMMDTSVEEALRQARDRLKAAMDDKTTAANALPGITRQYVEICERLQNLGDANGLFDMDENEEVAEDVGASVV